MKCRFSGQPSTPPPGNVTRADHHVDLRAVRGIHAGKHRRQALGRMAEIGIHRQHVAVAVGHGIFHRRDEGRSQTKLAGAMQAVEARIVGRAGVAPLARAVGRIVVDHQQIGGRQVAKNLVHQWGQILDFVIRGHDNERFSGIGPRFGHVHKPYSWNARGRCTCNANSRHDCGLPPPRRSIARASRGPTAARILPDFARKSRAIVMQTPLPA